MIFRRSTKLKWFAAGLMLMGAALCGAAQKKVSVRPAERQAQAPSATPTATPTPGAASADAQASTRYFYEFRQPDFVVSHVQIEHDAAGRGSVTFERKGDAEAITEPLQLSPAALQRITSLWAALNFLEGQTNFDSANTKLANIGTTRLRVNRDGRERAAEFMYSVNRDAFQLADEYRRAADQAVLVFELGVARENSPLDTPKLLERLDIMLTRKGLSDAEQLLPLLRDLSTDERLPLIARNQVARILKKLGK